MTAEMPPDVTKLLGTILGNVLAHPRELSKYGRVNLAGKAGAKLVAAPASVALLESVGFVQEADGHITITEDRASLNSDAIRAALAQVAPEAAAAAAADAATAGGGGGGGVEKLSMKQQARRMAEEREKAAAQESELRRKATLKQIETDNHVRKNDENWTTTNGISKGGKDINTFRGKYGEDSGG